MKILHIFRTKPDETVENMAQNITNGDESKVVRLQNSDFDWSALVDDIFSYEKVISWW